MTSKYLKAQGATDMSFAEDEGYDAYDPTDYDDDFNTWHMKGGKSIAVQDMDISHIKNCIKLLESQLKKRPVDYGPDPDDGDGAYWGKLSEERHNAETAENIERWLDRFDDELRHRNRQNLKGKGEF
jgi:hypothetical protein